MKQSNLAFNKYFKEQEFSKALNHVWHPTHTENLGSSLSSAFNFSFVLIGTLEKQQVMAAYHPCGRCEWSSRLLALAWPSPSCEDMRKWTSGSLSFCLSNKQTNKQLTYENKIIKKKTWRRVLALGQSCHLPVTCQDEKHKGKEVRHPFHVLQAF